MSFLILLAALLLAYYRPLPPVVTSAHWHRGFANFLEGSLNDGQSRHGMIAWGLAVLVPALMIGVLFFVLKHQAATLAAPFGLIVLYLVLDFSGFGKPAEEISAALRDNNISLAQERLAHWSGRSADSFGAPEISRVGIETTLLKAHDGLFAPVFWFILLGPAGALLYRLAQNVDASWQGDSAFVATARRAFYWLDWLPARFTAIGFAVAGDFEDALYCWRTQAASWANEAAGIMLASGAGALGVRLGDPLPENGVLQFRPALGLGDPADADYLMSTVGLVWRVLVLMLALMMLMVFANLLGA